MLRFGPGRGIARRGRVCARAEREEDGRAHGCPPCCSTHCTTFAVSHRPCASRACPGLTGPPTAPAFSFVRAIRKRSPRPGPSPRSSTTRVRVASPLDFGPERRPRSRTASPPSTSGSTGRRDPRPGRAAERGGAAAGQGERDQARRREAKPTREDACRGVTWGFAVGPHRAQSGMRVRLFGSTTACCPPTWTGLALPAHSEAHCPVARAAAPRARPRRRLRAVAGEPRGT
jgi:hypothetical protein